ncbi:uncharacterized protein LOC143283345 [Babylonia areolata]|uniref:uncharacterized protein LOC143283345 n=1 Tax=Babylonia areolata TaxID=304850 RepID=UPI003FD4BB3A
MSDMGSGVGQAQGSYQNGVWLTRTGGARSEKYQKWTEERQKSKVERLDKQKHSHLVKLNAECLQVRTELRGLQQDRRQVLAQRDRLGSSESCPSESPLQIPSSSISTSSPSSSSSPDSPRRRAGHKNHAPTGSSVAVASVPSSLSPSSSSSSSSPSYASSSSPGFGGGAGRMRRGGAENSGGGGTRGGGGGAGGKGVVGTKVPRPEESAMRLKNIHSSRALSKLMNNMDISN